MKRAAEPLQSSHSVHSNNIDRSGSNSLSDCSEAASNNGLDNAEEQEDSSDYGVGGYHPVCCIRIIYKMKKVIT